MKSSLVPASLLVFLLVTSRAPAQDAKIMTVADAAAPVPGKAVISDYDGPLPPEGPSGRGAIPQMPGWPITIGGSSGWGPWRGLVFADLNGNGDLEIIASSTDNKIHAWDSTGAVMPGFPVDTTEFAVYPPSIADVDGDGDVEIFQCTRGVTVGGRLLAVDHLGIALPGFPIIAAGHYMDSCPTLYDLDDDGVMEIVVAEREYPIGYLHVYEIDGTEWGGNWPITLDHVPTGTPAVGDVDADGAAEIFTLSYDSMYLLEVDGTPLPGWPRRINAVTNFSYQSAALADLDGDADLEIVVGAHRGTAGCYVFQHDGSIVPGWPKVFALGGTFCAPTVTDLEGDGVPEIIDGRSGYASGFSDCFYAWTPSGAIKPGFPYSVFHGGGSDGPLTVADIDGDGLMEVFADHNVTSNLQGYLFGVDAFGNDLPGFPLRPLGTTYLNGAMIGDVDGDGDYELGVLSAYVSGNGVDVNLYDLTDTYGPCRPFSADWTTYHARNARDGLARPSSCPGDLNCDGVVDVNDISAFVLALTDPAAYGGVYPDCDAALADLNGDGGNDGADVPAFVGALLGP